MGLLTKFEELVDESLISTGDNHTNIGKIASLVSTETDIPTAVESMRKKSVALLLIDYQQDFTKRTGPMYVQGADEDLKRLLHWMYDNIEMITNIFVTLDTHNYYNIAHPTFWGRGSGSQYVDPFTQISMESIHNNEVMPLVSFKKQVEYLKALEAKGKKLTVWPYHCIQGTTGHALDTQLSNMLTFISLLRKINIINIEKGQNLFTEMNGAVVPEFDPSGTQFNDWWLKGFEKFDEIYIAGEAKDYCVYETVIQMCMFFESNNKKDVASRFRILNNCCSSINVPDIDLKYQDLESKYGIKMINV